jgi:hypothetical protein
MSLWHDTAAEKQGSGDFWAEILILWADRCSRESSDSKKLKIGKDLVKKR